VFKITINEILSLQKAVRERLNSLKGLRDKVSTKDIWMGEREKVVEPQYNVKDVDVRITELETWLFKADSAVKQSNAVTQIELEADVSVLLRPLE